MKFAQNVKRVFLFLIVNALVITTLGIVMNVIIHLLRARGYNLGGNYNFLLVYASIWGMGGAIVSLLLSRAMAKRMMGVQVIDPGTTDPDERQLVQMVHHLARSAGLSEMPEVGYYQSPEVNAFATGPSRSHALVAVSTGLIRNMRTSEVEGVIGHEIAHIANGDMVTMTLIQGVVNAFAIFLSWILAIALTRGSSRDDDRGGGGNGFAQYMLVQVFQSVFMLLGAIVVCWFSRWREFRADAGGAHYAGRGNMISALKRLQAIHVHGGDLAGPQRPEFQNLKISGKTSGLAALFATHPPMEERIARLENTALS